MAGLDTAGRKIAGLLGYNPGTGIYSRLERAIQEMPANVRVQELPGLLKRYKEGVPGWELKAADLDSITAGRDVVPQDELLAAVRERSPVFTHKEVVLGGTPQQSFQPEYYVGETPSLAGDMIADFQRKPSPLGRGVSHARPAYKNYGQGGQDYAELLLLQPGARGAANDFGSHWPRDELTGDAVAHARYDIHGDALRINELQSDLGIHNRRQRELRLEGHPDLRGEGLPFPLEDAWADILIKRLALEAARGGHRAIEVASPRSIADKVGGNIDNYEHFYGKVVPGAIERLGRKMGGLTEDAAVAEAAVGAELLPGYGAIADDITQFTAPSEEAAVYLRQFRRPGSSPAFAATPLEAYSGLVANAYSPGAIEAGRHLQASLDLALRRGGLEPDDAMRAAASHMPKLMQLAEQQNAAYAAYRRLRALGDEQEVARGMRKQRFQAPGRRYIMSDEMRRRLIEGGVGASLLGGLMPTDTEQ